MKETISRSQVGLNRPPSVPPNVVSGFLTLFPSEPISTSASIHVQSRRIMSWRFACSIGSFKKLMVRHGGNMPEAENTLDALMENEMEQQVIETAKQTIPSTESHPVNATGFTHSSGQAVVEFTLVFLLFLVIAWIPADFGLAFYSGQLAQNASREAARIAAADPNLAGGSCTMPCSSAPAGTALKAAADRMSPALLPGALISVTLEPANGTNCNRLTEVSISGNYNFFFYRLLQGLVGPSSSISDPANIQRSTKMRWEHQPGCQA